MADIEEVKISTVVDDAGSRKTLAGLRKEANGLKDDLLNLDKGSAEYTDTLQALRSVQGQVTVAMREGREVSKTLDQSLRDVANTAAGVAGGFTAVKAAGALLGEENEALQKTFVQLQAGMALVQGLRQLGNGFFSLKALVPQVRVAFQAFNVTLMSNPIIAVATAVAALVAGLVILFSILGDSKSGVDELKASFEEYEAGLVSLQKEQDLEIRKLQAQGATEKEIAEARLQYAKDRKQYVEDSKKEVDDEIAYLEKKWKPWFSGQRKRLKELRRQQAEFAEEVAEIEEEIEAEVTNVEIAEIKERTAARNKAAADAKKAAEKAAADVKKAEEALTKDLKTLWGIREAERIAALKPEERLKEIDAEIAKQKELARINTEIANDEKQDAIARAAASALAVQAEQTLIALRTESATITKNEAERVKAETAQREALRLATEALTAQEKEYADLRERRNLTAEQELQRDAEQAEVRKAAYEAEAARIEAELEKEIEDNAVRIQLLQDLQDARENAFAQEQIIYNSRKKLDEDELKRKKKDAEDKKKLELAQLNATAGFLSAASSLLGENTVAAKALNVASATMSTYAGAAQVLADPSTPNPYLKWANFATTIVTGLAAVKSILSTKVEGANDSVSASTATTPSLPSFPELDQPITETHNNFDGYDEDVLNQSQTVLVVEDYNQVANRVKVAEDESTF